MATKKAIAGMDDVMEEMPVMDTPKKAGKDDPWSKMVSIRIPKSVDGSANYQIASVNGRRYKIKKGEQVEVPAPIAEVIQHSFDAEEAAELFMESLANK